MAEMLPAGVPEVMSQKLSDDVKTYTEAKDVIVRFLAFKDDMGPAPMDCSNVNGSFGMRGRNRRSRQTRNTLRNCMPSRRARARTRGRVGDMR